MALRLGLRIDPPIKDLNCGLFATLAAILFHLDPNKAGAKKIIDDFFEIVRECCPAKVWNHRTGEIAKKMIVVYEGKHTWRSLMEQKLPGAANTEFPYHELNSEVFEMMLIFNRIATKYNVNIRFSCIKKTHRDNTFGNQIVELVSKEYSAEFRPDRGDSNFWIEIAKCDKEAHFYWIYTSEEFPKEERPSSAMLLDWYYLGLEQQQESNIVFGFILKYYKKFCKRVEDEAITCDVYEEVLEEKEAQKERLRRSRERFRPLADERHGSGLWCLDYDSDNNTWRKRYQDRPPAYESLLNPFY